MSTLLSSGTGDTFGPKVAKACLPIPVSASQLVYTVSKFTLLVIAASLLPQSTNACSIERDSCAQFLLAVSISAIAAFEAATVEVKGA